VGCVEEDNCILVTTNKDFIGGSATSTGTIMTTNATIVGAKNGKLFGKSVSRAFFMIKYQKLL